MLGIGQTMGVGQCLRQGQRLLPPLDGLRGIPQAPQGVRGRGQASHAWRHPMAERQGPLLAGWIKAIPCSRCARAMA